MKTSHRRSGAQSKAVEPSAVIQRCSCGRAAHAGKSCEGCVCTKNAGSRAPAKAPVTLDDNTRSRVLAVLKERGEPLDRRVRRAMEGAPLGAPFGDVRVHRDGEGAATASLLAASAYTVGRHIVFGEGEYAPSTMAGLQLLAHELTHVVQQRGQAKSGIEDLVVGPEDDALERAARNVAAFIGAGQPVVVGGGSIEAAPAQAVVQREQKVCGPDVTNQVRKIWGRIENDFWGWDPDKRTASCFRLVDIFSGLSFNTDAFDVLPL